MVLRKRAVSSATSSVPLRPLRETGPWSGDAEEKQIHFY